jgi:hypothetical protein
MKREAELFIQKILQNKHGETVVVATPNNKVSVSVGDVFTLRYELSIEDRLNPSRERKLLQSQVVELTVLKIETYGKEVQTLDHRSGAAGGFYFSGAGLGSVIVNSFLRGSTTNFSLQGAT